MTKIFFLLILFSISLNSQNIAKKTNKLELHSISISPMSIYLSDRDGGLGVNISLSINKEKNILKLFIGSGSELNFIGDVNDYFTEYNLMYGRELTIKKWLSIDFFAGLGFFKFKYNHGSLNKFYQKEVIGFPIQSKIRFKTGEIFSLGLQLHSNINTATTIYNPGIFLQWKI